MKIIRLLIILVILCSACSFGCAFDDGGTYKTFVMDEGVIQFSLEYSAKYKIDWVDFAEVTGDRDQRSAYLALDGPLNRKINEYTQIGVGAIPPDTYLPGDAEDAVNAAENRAVTWNGYELISKHETVIDGIQAYRIDYMIGNIVAALAGGHG